MSSSSLSSCVTPSSNGHQCTTSHYSTSSLTAKHEATPLNLSTLRLLFAHVGAALTLFLATTDATILSTSLPQISADLNSSSAESSWIPVSYLLTQTCFQPLYGHVSDCVGRKVVLYTSMLIFTVGSVLCGAARSSIWLIVSRAIAGIGGGGIVACVWTLTSELVPEKDRAKWSQALSVTWSASAVAGPLLGGAFSGSSTSHSFLSWRWIFYLNVPLSLVAFLVLAPSLKGVNIGLKTGGSFKRSLQRFDFIGLLLLMSGSTCLVLGLSFSGIHGWTSAFTLANLGVGVALFFGAAFHECSLTSRDPLLPPDIFRNITTFSILVASFLHQMAFNAGTYYLPIFFQVVKNMSPFDSGVQTLAYTLAAPVATMPAAWAMTFLPQRWHAALWVTRVGLCVSAIGFGLMTLMDESSPNVQNIAFPVIAGLGIGLLFHAPYQVFLAALPPKHVAPATGAFFLVRFTGVTMGLALAGTIFQAQITHLLPVELPHIDKSSLDLSQLQEMAHSGLLRSSHAVALSIQTIWIACAPCLGLGLLISFVARHGKHNRDPNDVPPNEKA